MNRQLALLFLRTRIWLAQATLRDSRKDRFDRGSSRNSLFPERVPFDEGGGLNEFASIPREGARWHATNLRSRRHQGGWFGPEGRRRAPRRAASRGGFARSQATGLRLPYPASAPVSPSIPERPMLSYGYDQRRLGIRAARRARFSLTLRSAPASPPMSLFPSP